MSVNSSQLIMISAKRQLHRAEYERNSRGFMPWEVEIYVAFTGEKKAVQIQPQEYLKQIDVQLR